MPQTVIRLSHNIIAVYFLAGGVIAAALFAALPAVLDTIQYLQYREAPGVAFVARWALLVFLIANLQIAYGLYVVLVPDRASLAVVTLWLLASAGCYSIVMGLTLISNPRGWLIGAAGLQLADKLSGGQAALWCLCLTSIQTTLAFFAGRLFLRGYP